MSTWKAGQCGSAVLYAGGFCYTVASTLDKIRDKFQVSISGSPADFTPHELCSAPKSCSLTAVGGVQ